MSVVWINLKSPKCVGSGINNKQSISNSKLLIKPCVPTSKKLKVRQANLFEVKASSEGKSPGKEEASEEEEKKMVGEVMEYLSVFMHGRDEVNKLLKKMVDILDDQLKLGRSKEDALFISSASAVQESLDVLDRSFLLALDVELKNTEDGSEEKKALEALKEQVLLQLTSAFPPHVRVVSVLSSTMDKNHRKEIICQAVAGGGTFLTVSGGTLEVPAADLQSIVYQADDLIHTMEDNPPVTDRQLLSRLVVIREEARGLVGGGVLDPRNDTRKFRNVPKAHVDLMVLLMQLQGQPLTKKLTQVLTGEDERGVSQEKENTDEKKSIYPGEFLDSLSRMHKQMYKGESGRGLRQLQWIHHEVMKVLEGIAFPTDRN